METKSQDKNKSNQEPHGLHDKNTKLQLSSLIKRLKPGSSHHIEGGSLERGKSVKSVEEKLSILLGKEKEVVVKGIDFEKALYQKGKAVISVLNGGKFRIQIDESDTKTQTSIIINTQGEISHSVARKDKGNFKQLDSKEAKRLLGQLVGIPSGGTGSF